MKSVGITGEMGSGKSHCCGLFATLGIPVFLTDLSARKLMTENGAIKDALSEAIYSGIYNSDGSINRETLQYRLFECDEADLNRKVLNDVLYPSVSEDYERFVKANKSAPYTLLESALLFETDLFERFDYIIYVYCPEDIRVQRVIKRSGLSEQQQHARMKHLIRPSLKMRASDYIIDNNGLYDTVLQVDHIHDDILRKIKHIR